jgi:hypothetical protein
VSPLQPYSLRLTSANHRATSFSGQKATSPMHQVLVRSTPQTGHLSVRHKCQQRAKTRLMRCNKEPPHSITSSARPSNVVGMVRPSVLAVFRLMTNATFVSC